MDFNSPLSPTQALIFDQVDDAIALLNAEQQLVLFNQKLARVWHMSSTWLREQPTLTEILARLVAQGLWTPHQEQQLLQACAPSPSEGGILTIDQTNNIHLEVYITVTSDGGKLLILRDLTLQRQYQLQLSGEVRRLKFLLGLTERLQTSDSLKEIGRFSLGYLVEAMGAAFGDVKVISGEGKQRHAGTLTNLVSGQFIATHGTAATAEMESALARGIPYGQGLLWEVVESGQPVFVDNYANHPKAVAAFRHPAIGQLGIFPIPSADGTIIGVLTLESRQLGNLQEAPQQDMLLAACRILGATIERAQNHANLQQVNKNLELASRLKSEFLASMSHELRTPLNSILGFSELLLLQDLPARQTGHLKIIQNSGRHLLNLINDILDLSKVEAGKVELELRNVPIQSLCRQCLQMMQPGAERKRLQLSLELDYRVDQVMIDERRVRQIIINFLSNAIKFTPEQGSVKLSVRLAYGMQLLNEQRPDSSPVNASTPYLCIEVQDTGIGVAPEKQGLLFQPFQQIDSSLTRSHEGTGLGLALTKRMAELHGGTVSYESELGTGSRFRVWLPLNEMRGIINRLAATNASEAGADGTLEDHLSGNADQNRVLVVEDQPYNQALISELLELEGLSVEIVHNGGDMLSIVQAPLAQPHLLPQLILMDIQLPQVDGFELIRQLKAHPQWSAVPVIAVTAMAMPTDREACLTAGADAYISKPIDVAQLRAQVRQLLLLTESA